MGKHGAPGRFHRCGGRGMRCGKEFRSDHDADGEQDHSGKAGEAVSGVDGQQRQQRTDAGLRTQQLWFQYVSAQCCNAVENHESQSQPEISGDDAEQAPWQQNGAGAE